MEEFPGIRRILVPVAFTEAVPDLVRYAMAIVRSRGARVRLLHVVGPPVAVLDRRLGPALDPAVLAELRRASEERLRAAAREVRGIAVDAKAVVGSPAKEILREAAEWEADVVVIGTHGRTGVKRLVLGSVAEAVVRRCPCPVLTVRHARVAAG
jgi:nucleotide-binding universal stress UspA family protein